MKLGGIEMQDTAKQCQELKDYMNLKFGVTPENIDDKLAELKIKIKLLLDSTKAD